MCDLVTNYDTLSYMWSGDKGTTFYQTRSVQRSPVSVFKHWSLPPQQRVDLPTKIGLVVFSQMINTNPFYFLEAYKPFLTGYQTK